MTFRNPLAVLASLACTALPSAALAQTGVHSQEVGRFELTAIAGYQVNTDADLEEGATLRVGDAPVYGASLGYSVAPNSRAELLWLYSEPSARGTGSVLTGSSSFDVATHYFQVGGTSGVRRGRAELFGGATMGASLFMPGTLRLATQQDIILGDTWRFAFTLGGGVKVRVAPKVALRFETRVAAPLFFSSGGIYVGGGSAGLTASGGVPIWQWNFLGGLSFLP